MAKKRHGHKGKPKSKELQDRLNKSVKGSNSGNGKQPAKKSNARLPMKSTDDQDDRNDIVISNPNAKLSQLEPKRKENGDSGRLLRDPKRLAEDIKLVEQSISKGWNVKRKNMIVNRLIGIVEKTTGDMNTKDGIVESETVADKLAIDATKVLVAMDAQDMTRVKNTKPEVPSTVVNVTNNVLNNNGFDARTVELARLASNIGARTLTVSGKLIPINEILGTTDSVPTQEGSESDQG